jgi:hypothetical protein
MRAIGRSVGAVGNHFRIAGISQSRRRCRGISTTTAKELLGFPPNHRPTMRELRVAYFEAAKKTHPDVVVAVSGNNSHSGGIDFIQVTRAYEKLLDSRDFENDDATWKISQNEQDEYRKACQAFLGIPAEIVEESKKNPMFRHWLDGNTDGAQHWRSFFSVHGGLAQKLQTPSAYLESGQEGVNFKPRPRRRRGR